MRQQFHHVALRISLLYALLAALWILLSDQVMVTLLSESASSGYLQTCKGCLFVAVTALVLYLALRSQLARRETVSVAYQQALEALQESQARIRAERDRFEKIVATVPGVIYSFRLRPDGATCMPYASPGITALFGLQPEELARDAASAFALMHPEDVAQVRASIVQSARDLAPWHTEFRVQHVEKRYLWLDGRSIPEPEPDGSILWHGVLSDVTARHQQTEQLRQLSCAVEQSPASVVITDPNGNITYVNPKFTRLTGYSLAEVLGQNPRILKSGQIPPAIYAELWATIQQGREWRGDLLNRKKNGELYWEAVSISPIKDAAGVIAHYLAVKEDITARKQAEEQIRQLNQELERRVQERTAELQAANRELEAFSYSVSHDLRAPLRAIDGFSRILLEEYGPQLPTEAQIYLRDVRTSTHHLGQLVDDLLAFSRLGRQPLQKQTVAVAELVRRCLKELEPAQNGRQVDIRCGALPPCQGDPALLKQVWLNLLGNAFKYTARRAAAVIDIGAQGCGDSLVYFVKDNGVGFDMRYAQKLFGVFQRLHRAEDYEGTGVGLAIVQRIIHRHGGRVWAEAQPDQGATFYFALPPGGPHHD